jgi:hypothetical protein
LILHHLILHNLILHTLILHTLILYIDTDTGRSVAPNLDFLGSVVFLKFIAMQAMEVEGMEGIQTADGGGGAAAAAAAGATDAAGAAEAEDGVGRTEGGSEVGASEAETEAEGTEAHTEEKVCIEDLRDVRDVREDLRGQIKTLIQSTESIPEYTGFWASVYDPTYVQNSVGLYSPHTSTHTHTHSLDGIHTMHMCRQGGVVLRVSALFGRCEGARELLASVLCIGGGDKGDKGYAYRGADYESAERMMSSEQTGPLTI